MEQAMVLVAASSRSRCPHCTGPLQSWGYARPRTIRASGTERTVRPRRLRCRDCGATQVVLPQGLLARRRDAAWVIGRALRLHQKGWGARRIAEAVEVPQETVRGWIRRWRAVGHRFDPAPPALAKGSHRVALVAFLATGHQAGRRSDQAVWNWIARDTGGLLLANTS
jgi:transposase-like protein